MTPTQYRNAKFSRGFLIAKSSTWEPCPARYSSMGEPAAWVYATLAVGQKWAAYHSFPYPVTSCHILSHPVTSCHILSHPVRSCWWYQMHVKYCEMYMWKVQFSNMHLNSGQNGLFWGCLGSRKITLIGETLLIFLVSWEMFWEGLDS